MKMLQNQVKKIINHFIVGIFSLLPIAIAIAILVFVFGILGDMFVYITNSKDPAVFGIFIISMIILIIFIGIRVGKDKRFSIIKLGEAWLSKFPLIGRVISVIGEFTDMVRGTGKFKDLGVALIDFGGAKIYGLITNERKTSTGIIYTVFIVQGTFPPTGLVTFYKEEDVEIIEDMTPAEVFQLQITLGVGK